MDPRTLLIVTSIIGVVLFTVHLADDIVRGFEKGVPSNPFALPIVVAWMSWTGHRLEGVEKTRKKKAPPSK